MIEKSRFNYTSLILTLILITMAGVLASDIYVTALPEISSYFHAGTGLTQQSLSFYLFSLAIFQLVYGPLANIYGNVKVVLIGFLIFTFASLGCFFSTSISMLIVCRFIQAAGACAGLVISVAITGQMFNKKDSARVLSLIFSVLALSTAVSPIIGGYLTTIFSWRGPFAFISIFGIIVLIMIILFLKNGNKNIETQKSIKPTQVWSIYKILLSNNLFVCYMIIACSGYVAYFVYFAQSPFIFARFSLNAHQMGYLYSPLALSYVVGNFISNKLLKKRHPEKVMFWGICIFLLSGFLMLSMTVVHYFYVPLALTVFMSILTFSNGMFLPTSTAVAMSLNKNYSGVASGFIGFSQWVISALGISFIGHIASNTLVVFVIFVFIIAVICFISAMIAHLKIRTHLN